MNNSPFLFGVRGSKPWHSSKSSSADSHPRMEERLVERRLTSGLYWFHQTPGVCGGRGRRSLKRRLCPLRVDARAWAVPWSVRQKRARAPCGLHSEKRTEVSSPSSFTPLPHAVCLLPFSRHSCAFSVQRCCHVYKSVCERVPLRVLYA